jgi:tetratricopeptide (TPR) repeat protein
MNNLKIRCVLIAWVICSYNLIAQDVKATLNLARQLYERQQYKQCLDAYNRVDFFDASQLQADDYGNIANIYLEEENFEKAIFFFNSAKNSSSDSRSQIAYNLNKIDALTIIKKNDEAIIELFGLPETADSLSQKFINLYYGINYFELNQTENAVDNFKKAIHNNKHKSVDSLITSDLKLKHRIRPKKIRNLNWVLPGLGSAVMGDWKNAINASILTTGLGALTAVTIYKFGFFDGAIGVIPWFQRYYLGGADKSATIAKQKIEKNHLETLAKLIDLANSY